MIFLTVGTQFPFERLVQAIDEMFGDGLIDEAVFGQIGESSYKPRNFVSVVSLEKEVFDRHFMEASCIISHAGMGTIIMALENEKPLLVMPRIKKYGEVVNNHQVAIAKKFEERGHILAAYETRDLPQKIDALKSFVPRPTRNDAEAVIARISKFLNAL